LKLAGTTGFNVLASALASERELKARRNIIDLLRSEAIHMHVTRHAARWSESKEYREQQAEEYEKDLSLIRPSLPQLIEALKSTDPNEGATIAMILRAFGDEARDALPLLKKLLPSSEYRDRAGILQAILDIGGPDNSLLQPLLELDAQDPQAQISNEITTLYVVLGDCAIPALVENICSTPAGLKEYERRRVNHRALHRLVAMAKEHNSAATALLRFLDTDELRATALSGIAASKLRTDEVTAMLINALGDEDKYVRDSAVRGLADRGGSTAGAGCTH